MLSLSFIMFIYLFLQYYVVVTTCPNCSGFHRMSTKIFNETSFNQSLSCGQTYVFTITAFTRLGSSDANQIYVPLTSADVVVENLTVNYFPANLTDDDENTSLDRFLLTWDPPKNLSQNKIQVKRSLDNNLLLPVREGRIGINWA